MAVFVSHLPRKRRSRCCSPFMFYAAYILGFVVVAILPSDVATSSEVQGLQLTYTGPKCINITLEPFYYTISKTGDLYLTANNLMLAKNGTYNISLGNAITCYPLSQDIYQCNAKTLLQNEYQIEANQTLTDLKSRMNTKFGNYFITKNGSALVCEEQKPKMRKCNNLSLIPGEYIILSKDSLHIIPRNETIFNVKFTIEPQSQVASVCYPLSPEFLNCSKWLLQHNEYVVLRDKSIYDITHDDYISPGDYVTVDKKVGVCINAPTITPWPTYLRLLHGVPQILSAIALAIAIVIHLVLPDLSCQRALLICHSFSFMIGYICLAVRNFYPFYYTPTSGCLALFYICYYFITAAFCWLTCLAFDIWRITAHLRKGTDGYTWTNKFCTKKFFLNSLFGWGIPVILATFVVVVDSHEYIQEQLDLYPSIETMCWFNGRIPAYVFFYGPMCALLIINFLLFAMSTFNICKTSRYNEFTNTKFNNELLVTCFIVFLAMGLFWVMEVVSFSSGSNAIEWIVPDIINGCQGIITAIVYTCRPLRARYHRNRSYISGIPKK